LSNTSSLPEPQKLVARLARSLDGISNASARASVFWLVGQFAATEEKAVMGLGWEGVAPWVPDVLRKGIKGFSTEVGHALRRCDFSAD
jgi:AP-3 complex subunit beta